MKDKVKGANRAGLNNATAGNAIRMEPRWIVEGVCLIKRHGVDFRIAVPRLCTCVLDLHLSMLNSVCHHRALKGLSDKFALVRCVCVNKCKSLISSLFMSRIRYASISGSTPRLPTHL